MKLTARIKLETQPDSHAALLETMQVFNAACNFVSSFAFEHNVFSKHNLQDRLYEEIKARFDLPTQLICQVIHRVADAYRTSKTALKKRIAKYWALSEKKRAQRTLPQLRVCKFREYGAVTYDSRILTYRQDNTITIRDLCKRRVVPVAFVPDFDRATIKGEADLILQYNVFYLMQTIDVEEMPLSEVYSYLGIDLGMVHLAYDSEETPYDDPGIEKNRRRFEVRRSSLKKTKTKNSRRRLKKMGTKVARFQKDVNHCISKRLVQKAKALNVGLAMERLVNFFDQITVGRKQRAARHSWAFYQLRFFVEYKARRAGVPLVLVDPAYTSQECSSCHYIAKRNRPTQELFRCRCCGHTENADSNAAKVVGFRASVNRLEWVACNSGEAATTSDFGLNVGNVGMSLRYVCCKPHGLLCGS